MVNLAHMCTFCFPDVSASLRQKCHELIDEGNSRRRQNAPIQEVIELYEEALGIASSCEPIYHYGVALTQNLLAQLQIELGQLHKAETNLTALAKNSAVVKDFLMESYAYSRLGYCRIMRREYNTAVDDYKRSLKAIQEAATDPKEEIITLINLANALVLAKKYEESLEQLTTIQSGKAANYPALSAVAFWNTKWIRQIRGTDSITLSDVTDFVSDCQSKGFTDSLGWTCFAIWAVQLPEGSVERTEKWCQAAELAQSRFGIVLTITEYCRSAGLPSLDWGHWTHLMDGFVPFRLEAGRYLQNVCENDVYQRCSWTQEDTDVAKTLLTELQKSTEDHPTTISRVLTVLRGITKICIHPPSLSSLSGPAEVLEMENSTSHH